MKYLISRLLFICLLLTLLFQITSSTDCQAQFESMKGKCKRNYDIEENQTRLKIFCQNYAEIQEFNLQQHSYKKGINCLTDRTPQQIKSLSNLNTVTEQQQQLQLQKQQKQQQTSSKLQSQVGYPASLDWREQQIVTAVKDQEECSAGWAFATAAYCESKIIKENHNYDASLDLAEQYLLECTSKSSCSGGYMEQAMEKAKVSGIPKEVFYPYDYRSAYVGICLVGGVHCANKNYNYYSLTDGEMIKLLQKGPIAVSVASSGWDSYDSGIFSCFPTASTDHAVLIVGYTSTYWIVKNSWGSRWGMNGYIHITRVRTTNCKIGKGVYVMGESRLNLVIAILMLVLAFMI